MAQTPRFHPVHVKRRRPVATDLHEIVLDVGRTGLERLHSQPGQVVQVRSPGEEPAWFAIASAPDEAAEIELLVKAGGRGADALLKMPEGAALEVTEPMGKGFPMESLAGCDLLLFATGSGISAIRPVVHYVATHRGAYGRVILFFGARTADAFAYLEEIPEWERRQVEVHRVVSQPGSDEVWNGPVGHVQDVLSELRPDLSRAAALLCGVEGMHAAVRQTLQEWGMPAERILANY